MHRSINNPEQGSCGLRLASFRRTFITTPFFMNTQACIPISMAQYSELFVTYTWLHPFLYSHGVP